jgi:hypothetical protein
MDRGSRHPVSAIGNASRELMLALFGNDPGLSDWIGSDLSGISLQEYPDLSA